MKVLAKLSVVLCLFGSVCWAGIPTTHTITVRWTAPGDDGSSGKAYRYDIRFSTAPITSANWNQASRATAMPLPAPPGRLQTCTIFNLVPNTTYYFRMKTADEEFNWSGLSNAFSMTTCGGVCADTPGNVDCSPDNSVDIADLTVLIQYLFVSTDPMCFCLAEANVDSDPFNNVDIADISRLTDYLFISGIPLSPCH
jgi:hypothetical protein